MAPTFGAAGTQLQTTTANPSVDVPDGVVANSVVVITGFIDGALPTITLPSGFAHAGDSPTEVIPVGGGRHSIVVCWKRATGTESTGGTYDFTLSGSTYVNMQAIRYDDCITTGDPWNVTNSAVGDVNDTVSPAVSDTTTVDETLLVWAATNWSGGTWTPPTAGGTWTKRRDSGDQVCTVADKAQSAQGATGSITGSCVGNDRRTAWLGALMPVATAATPDGSQPVKIPWDLMLQLIEMGNRYVSAASATDVTVSDLPEGSRAGASSAAGAADVITTDLAQGSRAGGSATSQTFDLVASDLANGSRAAASAVSVSFDVVTADSPAGSRSGQSTATGGADVIASDAPNGSRAGLSAVSVTIDVVVADLANGSRAGTSATAATFDTLFADAPNGSRAGLSAASGGGDLVATDTPGGSRAGTSGVSTVFDLVLGSQTTGSRAGTSPTGQTFALVLADAANGSRAGSSPAVANILSPHVSFADTPSGSRAGNSYENVTIGLLGGLPVDVYSVVRIERASAVVERVAETATVPVVRAKAYGKHPPWDED